MRDEFHEKLKALSTYHREHCLPYRNLCDGLSGEMPYLPVSVFKELDLKSVPEEQIMTCLTSSGTTGQRVSKIYLDRETAVAQQKALYEIAASFLGEEHSDNGSTAFRRMPMLIIDTPDVLKKRGQFSARAAGILGFSILSTRRFYALDETYQINESEIRRFLDYADGKPFFVFGFTWLIWKYFYEPLKAKGKQIDLSGGSLIHGGGWKKLIDHAVDKTTFHRGIMDVCGIRRISDYYGMAEQTGSIYMECECGHLHVSQYSDVHILDPDNFSETSQYGLIAVDSLLPGSYPGHRLLTEDIGRLLGEDDCPCKRPGKYFEVTGRIPKSEVRGCSDTFETGDSSGLRESSDETKQVQMQDVQAGIRVMAGRYPPRATHRTIFNDTVLDFLDSLSQEIRKLQELTSYPDLAAFAFWCRRRHLEEMGKSYQKDRSGLGTVLHIAPSNMPLLFAYSWAASLLSGNGNVVRLSEKSFPETELLCACIKKLFRSASYQELAEENAIIRFARNEETVKKLLQKSDACMVWGGDETVAHMRALTPDEKRFVGFPDKYSIAVLSAAWVKNLPEEALRMAAIRFYQDTYETDQNACSSPHTVFWMTDDMTAEEIVQVKTRWWDAVAKEASRYPLDAYRVMQKYGAICQHYMRGSALKPLERQGNLLYVAEFKKLPESLSDWKTGFGGFFEYQIKTLKEIEDLLTEKIQTVVCGGVGPDRLEEEIRKSGCRGVDRVVSLGEALQFALIWDRKDLICELSE